LLFIVLLDVFFCAGIFSHPVTLVTGLSRNSLLLILFLLQFFFVQSVFAIYCLSYVHSCLILCDCHWALLFCVH